MEDHYANQNHIQIINKSDDSQFSLRTFEIRKAPDDKIIIPWFWQKPADGRQQRRPAEHNT